MDLKAGPNPYVSSPPDAGFHGCLFCNFTGGADRSGGVERSPRRVFAARTKGGRAGLLLAALATGGRARQAISAGRSPDTSITFGRTKGENGQERSPWPVGRWRSLRPMRTGASPPPKAASHAPSIGSGERRNRRRRRVRIRKRTRCDCGNDRGKGRLHRGRDFIVLGACGNVSFQVRRAAPDARSLSVRLGGFGEGRRRWQDKSHPQLAG
ncbi:hypothetical protein EDF57_11723 [Novosphingobium sp. PhB55]|nr:hypothetical protein EDF57_11723 [Novosphingobium sp. PhB55]